MHRHEPAYDFSRQARARAQLTGTQEYPQWSSISLTLFMIYIQIILSQEEPDC